MRDLNLQGCCCTTRGGWLFCLVGVIVAVLLPLAFGAAESATNEQFAVKLVDGTSLVCKPAVTSVPLKTSFADISIPLDRVESVKFDAGSNTVTVSMLNGDRMRGTIQMQEMKVASAIGDITIPLGVVREMITMLKREPVYEDTPERRYQCINNLRKIDAGKEQSALEYRWTNGTPVANGDARVNNYIKGNATPLCPAGGRYVYGAIGENPTCSVPGHILPGM